MPDTKYKDPLMLSDEEFMNSSPEDFPEPEEGETPPVKEEDDADTTENQESDDESTDGEEDSGESQEADSKDQDDVAADSDEEEGEEEPPEPTEQDTDANQDDPEEDPGEDDSTKDTTDYKALYEQVMAPFKANGRQIQVNTPDDAIKLMQMGANYHKKMADLKPSLKVVKLLEKHELLDESKINNLIDLNDKKPEAITQLLKDSGIDPMDIDTSAEGNYTPESRSISDTEMELDQVLEEIKDTETYSKTLNVITQDWDDASQNILTQQPRLIAQINQHVGNGIFDKVMDYVAQERSLGRLTGISDIEAYHYAGEQLHKQGHLIQQSPSGSEQPPKQEATPSAEDQAKAEKERLRKERKKAAQPAKNTHKATPGKEKNPLAMDDESFLKEFGDTPYTNV